MFASKLFQSAVAASLAVSVFQASQPAHAFSSSSIFPFIESRGPGVGGALNTQGTNPGSYGYFFDVNGDQRFVNALGFSAQDNWTNTNLSYTVELWSYLVDPTNPDPNTATTYTSLASLIFNPSDPGLLVGTDYWKPLPNTINLVNTSSDPNIGYVIAAIGNFNDNPDPTLRGNFFESGTDVTFSPLASYDANGFNIQGFQDFPVPVFDGGQVGYWNANLSIDVPGPLPLLGAGSAFVWSRRLKNKIKSKV
jgi:hypothetical protein